MAILSENIFLLPSIDKYMNYTQISFLRTILDSITEGVFTIDKDWKITSFNQAAEKIIGVKREWAIGKKCFEVLHANLCQRGCALKKTIKTGRNIIDLPVTVLNHQGQRIPISIRTAVLTDGKGQIVGGVETFRDLSPMEELKKQLSKQYTFEDIISKNHQMQKLFDILPNIAQSDSTVLIYGPSGSGKEILAKAIHNLSSRKNNPFVVVNCGALPDNLLESELFGYVKGAFTDAKKDKPGRFAIAEGGTVCLDEVGDISAAMQVKLLRVIQEKEYEPLGSVSLKKADVRIVSATHQDLRKLVEEGKFREDLYYRLNVVKLQLPPLKERGDDIPLLVDNFIKRFNLKMGKSIQQASSEVMTILMHHDFPGNVRELENAIEHAFVLCQGDTIEINHLPQELVFKEYQNLPYYLEKDRLQQSERQVIIDTLKQYKGHRKKTAEVLGINPSTLWRKMKQYQIQL